MNWNAAKSFCTSLNSHLVEIFDASQQSYIEQISVEIGLTSNKWTGLIKDGSYWRWDNSGTIANFFDWEYSAAATGGGNCVRLCPNKWHDVSCTSSHYPICQTSS